MMARIQTYNVSQLCILNKGCVCVSRDEKVSEGCLFQLKSLLNCLLGVWQIFPNRRIMNEVSGTVSFFTSAESKLYKLYYLTIKLWKQVVILF